MDSTGPGYPELETLWAFGATFIASVILISVLCLGAVSLTRPKDAPRNAADVTLDAAGRRKTTPSRSTDRAMDELLESLDQAAGLRGTQGGAMATVTEQAQVAAVPDLAEAAASNRLRVRRVLVTLLGPIATSGVFGAVSAALLPGAGGFLQSEYTINTFLILTFAYGWGGLVAYAVASLYLAASED